MILANYSVALLDLTIASRRIRVCSVADLASLVDRDALLRGEAEPPYWAYLWSGARVLAAYLARWVDVRGRGVLEIGCGLGLPGMTAAVMGAETTFVDTEPAALALVAASALANGVRCRSLVADFTRLDPDLCFDVILAAEVAYDRSRYAELAAVFERHLSPGGVGLLADGYRTDTRGLYAALAGFGFDMHAVDLRVIEEEHPMTVRLMLLRKPTAPVRSRDTPRPPL